MTQILDSGNRTEFETGAVRDIQQGKGRFDLMPIDVMAELFCADESIHITKGERSISDILVHVTDFYMNGHNIELYIAILTFAAHIGSYPAELMLLVAKHYEDGAKKYGEHNWEKGIPISRYIDSALRHLMKYAADMHDEPHDAAFVWNLMCASWTMLHKPELDDYTLARKTCG